MQHQKCSLDTYVEFPVVSQKQYSGLELSRVSPTPMAHDSVLSFVFPVVFPVIPTSVLDFLLGPNIEVM